MCIRDSNCRPWGRKYTCVRCCLRAAEKASLVGSECCRNGGPLEVEMKVRILMVPQACRLPATRSDLSLKRRSTNALPAAVMRASKMCCAAPWKAQDAEESWTNEERCTP